MLVLVGHPWPQAADALAATAAPACDTDAPAGLLEPGKMSRDTNPVPAVRAGARLSDPARQLHQAVLAAFAATGQPPPAAELERLIRAGRSEPGESGASPGRSFPKAAVPRRLARSVDAKRQRPGD